MPVKNRFKITAVTLVLASAAILSFQNCGQLTPVASVVQAQASIEAEALNDQQTIATVTSSQNLTVWINGQNPILQSAAVLASVPSQAPATLTLSPTGGLIGPGLVLSSTMNLPELTFTSLSNAATPISNLLASTSFSVITLLEGPVSGQIFSINSGASGVEDLSLSMTAGALVLSHSMDSADAETMTVPVPTGSGPIAIAASFGPTLKDVVLLVNGVKSTQPIVTLGAPQANTSSARQLVLGGSSSTLKIAEMMVLTSELAPYQLNTMSRYLAGRWGYAGVAYQPSLLPGATTLPGGGDTIPANVRTILTNNCATCHQHTQFASNTLSQFESAGEIVPGSASTSTLYTMLIGGSSSGTMPLTGAPLSSADLATIQNWINNLSK